MNIEEIRDYCNTLPGVTEDMKWDNDLCFCVAEKIFLIVGPERVPVAASFKVPPEEFETMISKDGVKPAPYLARYKWVFTDDIANFNSNEWKDYINRSYQIVRDKLPKKIRIELGLIA